jgi:anti-sigma-K factor RskA
MTNFPIPDNWQELVAGYVLNDLDPQENTLFQQLVATYPDVVQDVYRIEEVFALIAYTLPQQELPMQLRAQILHSIQAETMGSPLYVSGWLDRPRMLFDDRVLDSDPNLWMKLSGAIVAIVLLMLSVNSYRLSQQLARANAIIAELQQPGSLMYTLNGTSSLANASARLVITRDLKHAILVAHNLPQLPTGKIYRLWAASTESRDIAFCSEFNSDRNGRVVAKLPLANLVCSTKVKQVLVTTEASHDLLTPKGKIVLQSDANPL